ncbi:hypothetical protein [Blastococcus sp. CT_GayMR16]|uniref:hypothetical protein n=1 Tax=Blastococcus sp. CT_GayMR16 TaxID=2559607 RepID=UPI001073E2B2|nr:hypothetical protein [Blastococcus sp. CT_GayMR16]TFV88600.1 hypothetical protein E4P38_10570 [Blastococcus sp. CT_GayMR16]
MTVHDTRSAQRTTSIPQPRPPRDDALEPEAPAGQAAEPAPVGEFPWPEPWHYSRGARPRSEYWDVATASWRSRGPVVPPRQT